MAKVRLIYFGTLALAIAGAALSVVA